MSMHSKGIFVYVHICYHIHIHVYIGVYTNTICIKVCISMHADTYYMYKFIYICAHTDTLFE